MRRMAIPILLLSLLAACATTPWQDQAQSSPTESVVRTLVKQANRGGSMTVTITVTVDQSGDVASGAETGDASTTAEGTVTAPIDVSGLPGG